MTELVVVGSVNLDLVVQSARIPEPGETVICSGVEYRPGGKGANQAVAARTYGASVALYGAVGADRFGTELRDGLSAREVDVSGLVAVDDQASGIAMIVVRPDGENTVTVAPGANAHVDLSAVGAFDAAIRNAAGLLMQLEIPIEANLAAARAAYAAGVTVVLNAAPLPSSATEEFLELLRLTDVLIVNETEARGLQEHFIGIAGADLRCFGPRVVVTTLGSDGAEATSEGRTYRQPAYQIETVDAVGAGDAFCAVLATDLAHGVGVATAMRRACAAGAIATTRLGAQSAAPTAAQIHELLESRSGSDLHAS